MNPAPSGKLPPAKVRRWRRYLADERAEASTYRYLASRREGEEAAILTALADAENRHAQHWINLLGDEVGRPARRSFGSWLLSGLAKTFGSVFVLALIQRSEQRSPYEDDADASPAMAADERIHGEVVRALGERGRIQMSGTFRAAVFGANDGLVSNLALVLGIGATGVAPATVLFTGIAGLLAGALSMAAGEYVSVSSQRELIRVSNPDPAARDALGQLDVDANELALVYRARGMTEADAEARAARVLGNVSDRSVSIVTSSIETATDDTVGKPLGAAASSFAFFAVGAIVAVLPWAFGMSGLPAVLLAAGLVGAALLITGAIVGLLSGASPLWRALRQLAIGWGAAAVTYALGLAFGTTLA